jgi:hypothetical protein
MTRSMLLPLTAASSQKMSLHLHVALAACRREGCGNSHPFNELLRALYVTHHLQEMGFGSLPMEIYARAELGLNKSLSKGKPEQLWFVDAATAALLEQILGLHDQQLRVITLKDLTAATERLERFIRSQKESPLPAELRAAVRQAAAEDILRETDPPLPAE